jgi:hypothetical protein
MKIEKLQIEHENNPSKINKLHSPRLHYSLSYNRSD